MKLLKHFAKPINLLLVFLPVALIAEFTGGNPVVIFVTAALAVVPLSGILGDATEELAARSGPRIGALINATLGNAAELIITVLAIREGLLELVRASIIGSIIGNLLLVAGASMLFGGLKFGRQKFSSHQAGLNATMLMVTAVVLTVPALFAQAVEPDTQHVQSLSLLTAGVIIGIYVLSTIFSLTASNHTDNPMEREPAHAATMSVGAAVALLLVATVLIAAMSEFLVGAVEPMVKQIGISELFVGIILVPIIGNIAEHVVAIEVALKDKMELSMGIAIGSSLQVALLVAPLLVFISVPFGHPLALEFTSFEIIALLASCVITASVTLDGRSNWLEGTLLIGLYVILAIAFYYLPVGAAAHLG